MKNIGIAILIIGITVIIIGGFDIDDKYSPPHVNSIQISQTNTKVLSVYQLVGVAIVALGGGFYFGGSKKFL
jgi:hypothetical protein